MLLLTVSTAVFAALLLMAGAGKARRPAAAELALQGTRLPSNAALVRLLGIGEVAVATGVLAVGGAVPVSLLAVAYGAFAVFAEVQRRHGAACGCFDATSPATRLHVGVNAVAATLAVAAVLASAPRAFELVGGDVLAVVAGGALLAACAALLRALLTDVPRLTAAVALHAEEQTT